MNISTCSRAHAQSTRAVTVTAVWRSDNSHQRSQAAAHRPPTYNPRIPSFTPTSRFLWTGAPVALSPGRSPNSLSITNECTIPGPRTPGIANMSPPRLQDINRQERCGGRKRQKGDTLPQDIGSQGTTRISYHAEHYKAVQPESQIHLERPRGSRLLTAQECTKRT